MHILSNEEKIEKLTTVRIGLHKYNIEIQKLLTSIESELLTNSGSVEIFSIDMIKLVEKIEIEIGVLYCNLRNKSTKITKNEVKK